jgi:environmental stress-induced protein Ves
MRILRRGDCQTTPWKNGRGIADRLAIWPIGTTHEDCEWQVTRTRIVDDGPFSAYPGFDRHLVLLSGGALVLEVAGLDDQVRFTHAITTPLAPFAFRGEWSVGCRLVGGAAEVLNVFTRRGCAAARVDTLVPEQARPVGKPGGEALVGVVTAGAVTTWGRWGEARLATGDAVIVDEAASEEIALASAEPEARVVLIRIRMLS